MSNKPVIEVQNLSKVFNLGKKPKDFRSAISNFFKPKSNSAEKLVALDSISFDVNEGEVFGIIGPNGSGKSTLLKILSKITFPTSGKAILRGRVSSLLEVGTGFHHELTGRENIFLNGSILGMSKKEIKSKFDEIVDFSGVEKFIDTPVKHYSSGMYVRLAFSVAAHLEPEILLVDEVLSVGDMNFRKKSMGKMSEVAHSGRTVVLVSHNLGVVKNLCTNGLYLDRGKIKALGNIQNVVESYQNSFNSEKRLKHTIQSEHISVTNFTLLSGENTDSTIISCGDRIKFSISFKAKQKLKHLLVKLIIRNQYKQALFSCNNRLTDDIFTDVPEVGTFECTINKLALNAGIYSVDLYFEENSTEVFKAIEILNFEVYAGEFYKTSNMPYQDRIFLVEQEWKLR